MRPTRGRGDLRRFVDLPYRLHRDRPGFVPPLRMQEFERLDPRRNPFFQHARMETLLAWRDGQVVGRIAAIDDDLHRDLHGENLAFFGFFEATDGSVAQALLARVRKRAREWGRSQLRGPVNPSMNDSAGMQLDAFDAPPFVMMPFNPPEYPGYLEAAGFHKVKDLEAWLATDDVGVPERVSRLARRTRERSGVRVRMLDVRDMGGELERVRRLYTEGWQANWGQVPYTRAEFEALAREMRLLLDPRLVLFLEHQGETVGMCLGLPDLNQVLARTNGRLLPFGFVPLLFRRRLMDQMRLALLGVLPAARQRGFELVLIDEIVRRGMAAGYRRAELSWILEDNDGIRKALWALQARPYKHYRLYQRDA